MAPAPLGPLLFVHHKPSWQYGYVMVRCRVHGPRLEVAGCEPAFDRPAGELSGGWRWP